MTTTEKASPARQFANGDRVRFIDPIASKGKNIVLADGTVTNATLVGVRHPGWVYVIERDDHGQIHLPSGLLTAI